MSCHICGQEAVDRCFTCGKLFCVKHGLLNCSRCEVSIVPGERPDRIRAGRRVRDEPDEREERKAWWRAKQAEDHNLPACHICQGLARRVCRNCELHYCGEHAGPAHLCRDCGRSSLMGIWCLIGGLTIMAGIVLWGPFVDFVGSLSSRVLLGVIGGGMFVLTGYVLMTYGCMALFRKADRPGWIGFVPFWNLAVLLELAGKPAWWILLYFLILPIIPLQVLFGLGLAKNFGKSRRFGLGLGLATLVFLPMLALGDAVYVPVADNE